MSDSDEGNPSVGANKRPRRVQRACDKCRAKKVKCDGAIMVNSICSNCITNKHKCTYVEAAKKRGPPKGYVEGLENRLEKMEKLLAKLCPDTDFSQELTGILDKASWAAEHPGQKQPTREQSSFTRHRESSSSSGFGYPGESETLMSTMISPTGYDDHELLRTQAVSRGSGSNRSQPDSPGLAQGKDTKGRKGGKKSGVNIYHAGIDLSNRDAALLIDDETPMVLIEDLSSSDEDLAEMKLTQSLQSMIINPQHNRFFGKSSGVVLIQTALDIRNQFAGGGPLKSPILGNKRKEFWDVRPWEQADPTLVQTPQYVFPEADLIADLINLYFVHVNLFQPLLHRPLFERLVESKLHLTDDAFGSVLLLVLAVGSRFSDDPRVFLDGVDSTHTCGWKWFNQVQVVRKSLLAAPCLFDLQFYCLSVMFLQGSSAPQACWTMTGIGIRLAQDVGAHRRKVCSTRISPDEELWKRAFWVLVSIDRGASCALGRPPAISDEDFDIDLPVEVDDEYWEHEDPEETFKQPPGKPSTVAYFNCHLRLNQVLAFALRTIYSINKSKVLLGFVGAQWEQHIVAELDSALNKWIDLVPDHLRWDPNREDALWAEQSASLYGSYYHLQILIHRPFIPSPRKPSPLSFPSLAICTNAARSCSHVYDTQTRASKRQIPNSHLRFRQQDQMAVFTAGVVLLLNIWGGKRSGLQIDPLKEMEDVYKCMNVLKRCEGRWHTAGKLWDILYELASVGDLPLPRGTPPSTNKRHRDEEEPFVVSPTPSDLPLASSAPRNIAGSRRVSAREPEHPVEPSAFTLPVYSKELGRIPLHDDPPFTGLEPSQQPGADSWFYAPTWDGTTNPSDGMAYPQQVQSSSSSGAVPAFASHGMHSQEAYAAADQMFYDELSGYNGIREYEQQAPQHHQHSSSQFTPHHQQPQPQPEPQQHYPQIFPQQQQHGQQYYNTEVSNMWSTAPVNFEIDDWGSYINNLPPTYTTGAHGPSH